jgi:hypothetical protein
MCLKRWLYGHMNRNLPDIVVANSKSINQGYATTENEHRSSWHFNTLAD